MTPRTWVKSCMSLTSITGVRNDMSLTSRTRKKNDMSLTSRTKKKNDMSLTSRTRKNNNMSLTSRTKKIHNMPLTWRTKNNNDISLTWRSKKKHKRLVFRPWLWIHWPIASLLCIPLLDLPVASLVCPIPTWCCNMGPYSLLFVCNWGTQKHKNWFQPTSSSKDLYPLSGASLEIWNMATSLDNM